MKNFSITLMAIVVFVCCFAAYRYVENMTPVWSVAETKQAQLNLEVATINARADLKAHAERAAFITGVMQGFGSMLLLLLAIGGGVLIWAHYDKRQESKLRAVDGTFALQTFASKGQVYIVDPNKATFGVFGQNQLTGELITDAGMVGPDRQLTYALGIQKTRTMSAGNNENGIRYAAHAKMLSGAYDKNTVSHLPLAQLDAPNAAPYSPLTLTDAFNRSEPDNWLLGQNEFGACEFDVFATVNTGLLGATKCGKTSSTALLMALNAAKHDMKVIALDGAGGFDWMQYQQNFEVYETDYTVIGDQLDQIVRIHNLRMKAVKLAGVVTVDELPYQMPNLFVILDEFGKTMQAFRAANKAQYDATIGALSNLMRVCRKTGIYFLIIDQSMVGWDQAIKPNIKDYISYHLGGNQGAAFNAYKLHELKPKGQFWNNGNVYDAWYTRGEAKPLLQKLPPLKIKMLTDSISSTSIDRGVEVNNFTLPPTDSTSTGDTVQFTPENDTGTTKNNPGTPNGNPSTAYPLTGKPTSTKDKNLVLNTYAMEGSLNKVCMLLWGGQPTPGRKVWIKEILAANGVEYKKKGETLQ